MSAGDTVDPAYLPLDTAFYDDLVQSGLNVNVTTSFSGASLSASFVIPSTTELFAIVSSSRITFASGAGALTNTYTASQDTYVDLSNAGAFTYVAVANGATAPAITASSIRLAKVVTNGSGVTTFTILSSLFRASTIARYCDLVNDLLNPGVGTSFAATLSGSFTIAAGTNYFAIVLGQRVFHQSLSPTLTRTYTASKDTYADLKFDGTFTYVEVSNGAGAPALTAQSLRIAKVVTNGTQVTAMTILATTVATLYNSASSGLTDGGSKSSSFSAVANTRYSVTGTATCTLPTAVGVAAQSIEIFVASGGTVTFNTTSSQTINSASNHASGTIVDGNQGNYYRFVSDNANWQLASLMVGI